MTYLIINVTAREQRPPSVGEFSEDTAGTPHIYAGRVELGTEQNVWRTIPEGDHFSAVASHWDTKGPS